MRLMACSGIIGYGFLEESFRRGLEAGVSMIGCDAGSMDPGPFYLGTDAPFVSEVATRRDIEIMLIGALEFGIPMIIGSAGGGGSNAQVAWTVSILEDLANKHGMAFKLAVINAEPDKGYLKDKLASGKIAPLGPIDDLTVNTIDQAARIVAMMGVEPLQTALAAKANVIIAGRCSDAAIYAALPIMLGYNPAQAWHLGKIVECGAQVIEPREGQDCIIGTLRDGYFEVEPGHPEKHCTKTRVAAHTLYENPLPHELKEPSGVLDSTHCSFQQIDPRTVRVSGSSFLPTETYTVKLEGVRKVGHRSMFVAGIRDPILINQFDAFSEACRERTREQIASLGISDSAYTLKFRTYGHGAVMGDREFAKIDNCPIELCVIGEVIADTEAISRAVLAKARYSLLHTDFEGRLCISGNLAFPFSPSDISVGEVYDFNVWHTLKLDDPLEPFQITYRNISG